MLSPSSKNLSYAAIADTTKQNSKIAALAVINDFYISIKLNYNDFCTSLILRILNNLGLTFS